MVLQPSLTLLFSLQGNLIGESGARMISEAIKTNAPTCIVEMWGKQVPVDHVGPAETQLEAFEKSDLCISCNLKCFWASSWGGFLQGGRKDTTNGGHRQLSCPGSVRGNMDTLLMVQRKEGAVIKRDSGAKLKVQQSDLHPEIFVCVSFLLNSPG